MIFPSFRAFLLGLRKELSLIIMAKKLHKVTATAIYSVQNQ
jgi:hypothetical protein